MLTLVEGRGISATQNPRVGKLEGFGSIDVVGGEVPPVPKGLIKREIQSRVYAVIDIWTSVSLQHEAGKRNTRMLTYAEVSLIPLKRVLMIILMIAPDAVLLDAKRPPPRIKLWEWSPVNSPLDFIHSSCGVRCGVPARFRKLRTQ
jgi:hypothetical protein